MKKIFALLLIVLFPTLVFAQTNKTQEIKRIDSLVKQIDNFVKRNSKTFEVYADVSQTEKPQWRKFKSEKALEKFREHTETYQIAYVWRRSGKVIAANFTNFSGSGDWAHYLNYYFRPDGSLAKIEADLDTFYGNAIVERQFYFVKNGELIRRTKRVSDLKTHKPKKLNEDFIDEEVYLFKKVSKLPFASLLRN